MRTWRRAVTETICGGPCRQHIRKADPTLEIHIQGLKRALVRCASCAGEPVPTDLPPLEERPANTIDPTYKPQRAPLFASVGTMATDWKARQSGERQPGEDG